MSVKEDYQNYILNTYNRFPITFVKGKGVYLYTDDGKEILDMASGIAVSAIGHSNRDFVRAIKSQAENLVHTSNLFYTIPQLELAKKLVENSIFQKVFFCNSGAEANEGAIKLARKFGKSISPEKYQIITMKNSFHGRTITTLSATGQTKYQKGFEPLTPGFSYVELNNEDELRNAINENTAAIMIEVVQGEGGIKLATQNYLKLVRELCDKYNVLLIFDEIQTGIGRTGKLFGYEHFLPVEPDIITLAKGLGGGMPLGAFLLKDKISQFLQPGEHASTFGGNLVCTAGALAVLNIILKNKLTENANKMGEYFRKQMNKLKKKYSTIKEVRGLGLLNGIELTFPARDMINQLIENNIVAIGAGENVVRFIPPLIITKKQIDIVVKVCEKILKERN
ncbi:MAG: acetylornithine aminotransferase [Spirochaetes bacterium GWD1_27_9]|nr:MAG: acetylornithine aminotransferase [Spirochaetes bacterium GWB1_27_13]OHD29214.1 MAG: acetylornithine aminotransferase [Spirochaetes bacterium GWD1_27_9]